MKSLTRTPLAEPTSVALFTRAWIEMDDQTIALVENIVALFTRAWIEIQPEMEALDAVPCRPLHEGVD